jgi:protein-S-isoprenylcysteine O-methyltransferase Ste14
MFVIARATTYATLFVGLIFIYLPGRVLTAAGVIRPPTTHWPQIAGIAVASLGAALALWCASVFVRIGKGTPAPFDPPRRLVTLGPYRLVRNPMYIGAGLAMTGLSLFYGSLGLLAYGCGFLLLAHCFVMFYEEPALRRSFGREYRAYCDRVRRWWPHLGGAH